MRLSPVAATRLVSGAFLGGALLGALLVVAGAYVLAFGPVTDRLPAVAAVLGGGGEGGWSDSAGTIAFHRSAKPGSAGTIVSKGAAGP